MSGTLSILPDAHKVYREILTGGSATSWAVFTYAGATPTLKLDDSGDDTQDFQDAFDASRIQYGFLRVGRDNLKKFVLVLWCGAGVPATKKTRIQQHAMDVRNVFRGFHIQVEARSEADITPATILQKIHGASCPSIAGDHLDTLNASKFPVGEEGSQHALPNESPPTFPASSLVRGSAQGQATVPESSPEKTDVVTSPNWAEDSSARSMYGGSADPRLNEHRSSGVAHPGGLVAANYNPPEAGPRCLGTAQSSVSYPGTESRGSRVRPQLDAEEYALLEHEEALSCEKAPQPNDGSKGAEQGNLEHEAVDVPRRRIADRGLRPLMKDNSPDVRLAAERFLEGTDRNEGGLKRLDEGLIRRQDVDSTGRRPPISSAAVPAQGLSQRRGPVVRANWMVSRSPVTRLHPPRFSRAELSDRSTSNAPECTDVNNAVEKLGGLRLRGVLPQCDRLVSLVAHRDYEAADGKETGFAEGEQNVGVKKTDSDWRYERGSDGLRVGLFQGEHVTERSDLATGSESQDVRDSVDGPSVACAGASAIPVESHGEFPSKRGVVVVALYDYEAQDNTEITFQEGDHIFHVQKDSPEWWSGSRAGTETFGYFPANYVQEA